MHNKTLKQPTVRISDRTVKYALRIIGVTRALQKDAVGRVLGLQLLRSGTSVGANVHEAQAAQTRADFIAKISIAHKEACESEYWLRLLDEACLLPAPRLADLRDETTQIAKILAAILIKAKKNASDNI